MEAADHILFTDFGSHPTVHQEARAANKLLISSVKCLFICITSEACLMQVFVPKIMHDFPTKQILHKLENLIQSAVVQIKFISFTLNY